ncbi:hypothetical protein HD806DRAFT_524154 [Xylariaceae sp. AK1471]|nr:hypothetical protein HD806DRAFT_524154 [Xylariaceae sp. AK1471]
MIPTGPEFFDIRPHCLQNPQIIEYVIPCLAALNDLYSIHRDKSRASELLPKVYRAIVTASGTFRTTERSVNPTNWPSVGLFNACYLMFQFGTVKFVAANHFNYLEIFQSAIRGSNELRKQLVAQLRRTELLGDTYTPDDRCLAVGPTYDAETRRAFELLASAKHPEGTPGATIDACGKALGLLKDWAIDVDCHPRDWSQIFYWPSTVSDTFVHVLKERQPVATLIFIHWCAIMYHAPKAWFLDGWARRTMFAAMGGLPAVDDDLLRWPRTVFDHHSARRAKLCLTLRPNTSVGVNPLSNRLSIPSLVQ